MKKNKNKVLLFVFLFMIGITLALNSIIAPIGLMDLYGGIVGAILIPVSIMEISKAI